MQKENEFVEQFAGHEIFKRTNNMDTAAYLKTLPKRIKQSETKGNNYYKFYVGKGNNSVMVRTLLKARFWWQLHDKEDIEKVNFMWTQLRKANVMGSFRCKLAKKGEEKQSPALTKNGQSSMRVSGSNQRRKIWSAMPAPNQNSSKLSEN